MDNSISELIKIVRLNTKLLSLFLAGLLLHFAALHLQDNLTIINYLNFVSIGGLVIGYLVGFKFEIVGGFISTVAVIMFYFSIGGFDYESYLMYLLPLPAVMFFFCNSLTEKPKLNG
ncbi:MAG: hypothetical protein KF816_00920 [Melioribacteraceae bacterium]|nr:hypothetical protein [Melioribacteraceae bacterium]